MSGTFGHQEQTNYNAHYQTYGYHPLVVFDVFHDSNFRAMNNSG
ncbi:transposase [Aerococcus urinaeequi]|uniref:Transposase n=1 Tax=Aerococcus urinaeequi TaxID=51665 RepID=A0AA47GD66_9LACT|nr:transposase [Aerococcus urinaeequi]WAT25550.1 transposase [Aerococcus urinaeequi]